MKYCEKNMQAIGFIKEKQEELEKRLVIADEIQRYLDFNKNMFPYAMTQQEKNLLVETLEILAHIKFCIEVDK